MYLPPYLIFPTLSTDNLTLREVLPSDINDVLEISVYDGRPAADAAEALGMFQKIDNDYRQGTSVNWGIADKTTNIIMGTCGYYRGFPNATGELGCVMRPAFRGKGIMTEAMQAAVDFGFREIGLERIVAITREHNLKARALLGRLGFLRVTEQDVEEFGLREVLEGLKEEQMLFVLAKQR